MTIFDGKQKIPEERTITNPTEYFMMARASRDTGKATIDLLFDDY